MKGHPGFDSPGLSVYGVLAGKSAGTLPRGTNRRA